MRVVVVLMEVCQCIPPRSSCVTRAGKSKGVLQRTCRIYGEVLYTSCGVLLLLLSMWGGV